MESPSQISGAGNQAGSPAQGAGVPSPELAELLRRKASGEKLSPREYGKLGAHYRGRKPAAVAPEMPGPSRSELLAAAGAVDRPSSEVDLPCPPPVDPELVRRTTEAILQAVDGVACRWIEGQAIKSGADKQSAALITDQARLQDGQRAVMVETSPVLLDSLGVNSANYPIAAFCVGLVTWLLGIFGAIVGLRNLQKENHARPTEEHPGNHDQPAR